MAKNKNSYKERYYNFKEPWEEAKEGCWIVVKKNGCTSMSKIDSAAYPEIEYALVKYYDIIVNRFMEFINTQKSFSAAELALDSAKKLRELVIEQQTSYTNNTKGD